VADERAGSSAPAKDVAVRGLKRAQEALRVLEEYVKAPRPDVSKKLSALRFEMYDAEQWLVLGADAARILHKAKLYVLITAALCTKSWEQTAEATLKGGACVLQLREKDLSGAEWVQRSRTLCELCEKYGALCVVNDRADVALTACAPCVHLGQEDLSPGEVRRWGGAGLLIGRSTHSLDEARRAVEIEHVDYIAVGAMYATTTKAFQLRGPALARDVVAQGWEVPIFAIGGITVERTRELQAVGIRGVAVSSAVISARDPERAAAEFIQVLGA